MYYIQQCCSNNHEATRKYKSNYSLKFHCRGYTCDNPSFPPSLPPPKGPRVKLLSAIGRKDEFSDNDEEDDDNNLVTYNDNGLTDSTLRNASS